MPFTISRRIRLVPAVASVSVCIATAAISDINSGAYLAARQAGLEGNYRSASEYFYNTLIADPSNLGILEQTMTSFLGTGQVESAAELGWNLIEEGGESQIANMAIMAQSVKMGDWGAVFDQLEAGHEVGPLLDGIVQSWAYIAQGNNRRGLESFDELIDTPGLRPFGLKHKAVALTLMGDLEGADAIYALPLETGFEPTRASVMAHLQVLCALGEYERASALLTDVFGADAGEEVTLIREAIAAEGVPYLNSYITTPVEAVAQAFQDLAEALQDEANASYLLLYTQAARYIAPQDASAHIAAARLLNDLEQYSEAAEIFAQVHPKDPAFQSAEMGRADSLRRAGELDRAVEVLRQLTRDVPDEPMVNASLGDLYRQKQDYENANRAYDASLRGFGEGSPVRWWLLYSRGITYERMDMWAEAEADFRASLSLNPGNPSVLNYLGYSLVDRGLKYEEALGMIEQAVAARPNNGAIVDSLGWVYYKLGRYEEAVGPLERAAELEPNDPIVSDHLADAYWKVGRYTEAQFQWRRALSFEPEETTADRIRRKLAIGLDAVYAENGTEIPAVEVANDIH